MYKNIGRNSRNQSSRQRQRREEFTTTKTCGHYSGTSSGNDVATSACPAGSSAFPATVAVSHGDTAKTQCHTDSSGGTAPDSRRNSQSDLDSPSTSSRQLESTQRDPVQFSSS